MPGAADRFGQLFSGDAVHGWFARGVYFGDHQNVGLIERAPKIFPEVLGAGVAVRLKENQQAVVVAAAGGFERGANFGGMMAVVVDQGDAVEDAFDFEAATNAGKFGEAGADQIRRDVQRKRDGGRSGGVAHIVNSRRGRQAEESEIFAVIFQAKFAGQAVEFYVGNDQVGLVSTCRR